MSPVPLSKGLRIALIVETSNDESPTRNEISAGVKKIRFLGKKYAVDWIKLSNFAA